MSHHHHAHGSGSMLRISLVATLLFTVVEVYAGIRAQSLSLLSDAGHNFTDALALGLAAVGAYLQAKPADETKTFGYQRANVLAAFVNALTLIVISVFIVIEAGKRFLHPEAVNEQIMIWVALGALVLNGTIMIGLHRGAKGDLNLRAAFVHMMGDALGAVGILIGALVIRQTGWIYIDPILSLVLAALIFYSALDITRESLNILLEGLPRGIELSRVTEAMSGITGVLDVHDLHIWSLGAKTHALSSHVLIDDMPPSASEDILCQIRAVLAKFGIGHTTIQFEHVPCVLSDCGCTMMAAETGHEHHQH